MSRRAQLSRLARTGDDVRHLRCIRCGAASREGLCPTCRFRRCRLCGSTVECGDDGSLCTRCRKRRDALDAAGYPSAR